MSRMLFEVVRTRNPEELAEIAANSMRLLEEAERLGSEEMKSMALGMLSVSRSPRKKWTFYWPPRVEVEWHFDDLVTAKQIFEAYKAVGVNARLVWRESNGGMVPAIVADWREIDELRRMLNAPGDVMDVVAERFVAQRSLKKALRETARDLAMLAMAGVMDLSEVVEVVERKRKRR